MADAGPNYSVEQKRLLLQKMEHEKTMDEGRARLASMDRQKSVNLARAELANDELDSEAEIIRTNEKALARAIADIDKRIDLMVKESKGDG